MKRFRQDGLTKDSGSYITGSAAVILVISGGISRNLRRDMTPNHDIGIRRLNCVLLSDRERT